MIRIAIADDHHQVRETWNFILSTNKSFQVVATCCNGKEAVEAAAAHNPDVILMDINMDLMTGIEATEIITASQPNIRIVAMSIHVEPVYVRKMLNAGAFAYVTKNSSYTEVFDAIEKAYDGKKYICLEVQEVMPELSNEIY
ncbi:MAG: response regulator transcription factor [Gemmatimonadaceae bacterium]|nr:response regulator transcription factor [Chitinophagaceae bacterium]